MFETLKTRGRKLLSPITKLFVKLHPNFLTLIGFLITVFAGIVYARGIFWLGGVILLVGGLFDVLDGEVAKLTNRVSKFGAFLDSCIDRYSDFIVLFGIFWWYMGSRNWEVGIGKYGGTLNLASILIILTILGSFMVSYTRARAEGIGIDCKVGLGERAFRVPVIVLGSLFGPKIFIGFLWLLAIITNLTAFYRMYYIGRRINE
ncbi:CDP-alcohol phosphatidyltransferase family protein [candidate division WOR-3 bacterium]|nr:CDP-alcohol phosphatidyltransferase family protein [candidate division WOR-3 bacterium]